MIFGLCWLLALAGLPAYAVAETCIACRYFETIESAADPSAFSKAMAGLVNRSTAVVSLNRDLACSAGQGAAVAAELGEATDRQFSRTRDIIRRSRQCRETCAPALSEADYCAYRDRMVADRYRLGAVALRLTDLAELYGRADQQDRLPLEILSADMTLYGGQSLTVLTDALRALATGDSDLVPALRWQASTTELSGLHDAMALLADLSLIEGDTKRLETALEQAAGQLSTLRETLIAVLASGRTMRSAQRQTLERRILMGAANLAWVIASLQISAEAQHSAAGANRSAGVDGSTDAMVVPRQGTIACLNRLSRDAYAASEAPGMTVEFLDGCRSFASCPPVDPDGTRGVVSPLRSFLSTMDETDQRTSRLVGSMCKAN